MLPGGTRCTEQQLHSQPAAAPLAQHRVEAGGELVPVTAAPLPRSPAPRRGEAGPPHTLRSGRGSCTASLLRLDRTLSAGPRRRIATEARAGTAAPGPHAHPRDRSPGPAWSNPQFWIAKESRPPQRRPSPGTSGFPEGWGGSPCPAH